DLDVELDRLGHLADGQVAGHRVAVTAPGLDPGGAEGQDGILGGVEEVGRAQVLVALLVAGVDRGDLERELALRSGEVVTVNLDVAVVLVEAAADGGEDHVLGGEAQVGVVGIELVSIHVLALPPGGFFSGVLRLPTGGSTVEYLIAETNISWWFAAWPRIANKVDLAV